MTEWDPDQPGPGGEPPWEAWPPALVVVAIWAVRRRGKKQTAAPY